MESSAGADAHRAADRRQVVRALSRSALTVVCLLVAYYTLPLSGAFTSTSALLLGAGLLVLGGVIAWQARAIANAARPRLRAVEALMSSIPLFLLMFATAYYLMGAGGPGTFSVPLTRTGALYYTVTVFSTVGFGDITPRTEPAQIVTMVQMLGDLVLVGLVARVFLQSVQRGVQRRSAEGGGQR
jgi:voltage-gated potassium channel